MDKSRSQRAGTRAKGGREEDRSADRAERAATGRDLSVGRSDWIRENG